MRITTFPHSCQHLILANYHFLNLTSEQLFNFFLPWFPPVLKWAVWGLNELLYVFYYCSLFPYWALDLECYYPEFEYQLCHFQAMWPWASHLTFLSHSFYCCKIELIFYDVYEEFLWWGTQTWCLEHHAYHIVGAWYMLRYLDFKFLSLF